MSDTPPASAAADLAYLKRLAAAGRGEPAPFLLLMAVFGGAYGAVLLSVVALQALEPNWIQAETRGPWFELFRWSFVAAHGLFLLTALWTAWRTFGPNRIKLSRSASAVWSAAFIALVVVVTAFRIYSRDEPATDQIYTTYMLPPVLLVLWGCAWWVTAIMSQRPWLFAVAVGSFIGAVAMAVVGNSPPILMLAAACLILLACLPAVVLMLERRR